jgi:hypothetical protein
VHVAYLTENQTTVPEEENIERLKEILDDILEKQYSVNLFSKAATGPLTFAEIFKRLRSHDFEEHGKESGYDTFEVGQYCEWVDRKMLNPATISKISGQVRSDLAIVITGLTEAIEYARAVLDAK